MKTLLLLASVAVVGLAAAPAMAQDVTGSLTVTGTVTSKCIVVSSGGSTFTGSIPLGELDNTATGQLSSALSGSTTNSPAGTPVVVQVSCNTVNPSVTLSASQLATTGTATSGYANAINYTAEVDANLSPSGSTAVTYTTPAAATLQSLGGPLANAAGNITIKAYALSTVGGNSLLLLSGDYTSTITVTIAPT